VSGLPAYVFSLAVGTVILLNICQNQVTTVSPLLTRGSLHSHRQQRCNSCKNCKYMAALWQYIKKFYYFTL
jgi:hypothetical protein